MTFLLCVQVLDPKEGARWYVLMRSIVPQKLRLLWEASVCGWNFEVTFASAAEWPAEGAWLGKRLGGPIFLE